MEIGFIAPFQKAWARMKALLFQPFDPGVWLTLGLVAFLAGQQYDPFSFGGQIPWDRVPPALEDASADPRFVYALVGLGVVVLVLALVLAWVFARGTFVFLDDVMHARLAIAEPWTRFRRQGNSLFLWRIGFGLGSLLVLVATLGPFVAALRAAEGDEGVTLALVVPLIGVALVVGLALAFVQFLANHVVVPIMWAHGLTVLPAWGRALTLVRMRPGAFVLFALFVLGLSIVVAIAVMLFGCGTLCVGFCAMMIPVIGAAVLLPVSVPLRALGPEFLAQFGPEAFPPPPAPRAADPEADAGPSIPGPPPVAGPPWGGPSVPPQEPPPAT